MKGVNGQSSDKKIQQFMNSNFETLSICVLSVIITENMYHLEEGDY